MIRPSLNRLPIMSESEGNSFNENEDDQVVGLVEYINDQNAEIEQANLILEASESDSCTYSLVCRPSIKTCNEYVSIESSCYRDT